MKVIRKPLVSLFIFLVIASTIFFMSSSPNKQSLGKSSPINLMKDAVDPTNQDPVKQNDESNNEEKPEEKFEEKGSTVDDFKDTSGDILDLEFTETPFMPKMANETLKAQLGNAAWKLFHTILARYPEKPTTREQQTLSQYIHLFAQVYPCGDCARHFQQLLQKYPPQTNSRITAAVWGCDIHNKVNKRLEKPEYDCSTILEDYDCGCGSDEKEEDETLNKESIDRLKSIQVDEKEEVLQLGG